VQDPDQRLFEADLLSAEFRSGNVKGQWGLPTQDLLPDGLAWPKVVLWIAAAPRASGQERFYLCVDAKGYRSVSPTGTLWDPVTKVRLEFAKYPQGKPQSRCAKVFRTDWGHSNQALYHPYDRFAAETHGEWKRDLPQLIWTSDHTIVDYLEEFHALLHGGDYLGI
jgi:hypothetical protein